MSKRLAEIRVQIDDIDNKVHDLLMERASLVSSVAEAKRQEGLQIVQPAREARMIRRLLDRHKGPLPRETVVRIWRELVGSVSLLQTGLSVVVFSGVSTCSYWDMAKDYFGSAVPMKAIQSLSAAMGSVRNHEASFAVMPWPEAEEEQPWWTHLFVQSEDEKLSVICALPYGQNSKTENHVGKALVVSAMRYLSSSDDISFIGLETDQRLTRMGINDVCSQSGLNPLNVYSAPSPYHGGARLNMIEVSGYIEDNDQALVNLKDSLGEQCQYCSVLGGYPAWPDL